MVVAGPAGHEDILGLASLTDSEEKRGLQCSPVSMFLRNDWDSWAQVLVLFLRE